MADREKIKGKLRALQQIKEEKYIGTSDALRYVNRVSQMNNDLDAVVSGINYGVSQSTQVVYPATLERVFGFVGGMNLTIGAACEGLIISGLEEEGIRIGDSFNKSVEGKYEEILIGYCSHPHHESIYEKPAIEEPNPNKLINHFVTLFKSVQSSDMADQKFGKIASGRNISGLNLSDPEREVLYELTKELNWGKVMSQEMVINVKDNLMRTIEKAETAVPS